MKKAKLKNPRSLVASLRLCHTNFFTRFCTRFALFAPKKTRAFATSSPPFAPNCARFGSRFTPLTPKNKRLTLAIFTVLIAPFGFFWIFSDVDSLDYEPHSLISFDKHGELLSFFVNERDNFKVSIDAEKEEIPPLLRDFIVLYEDKRFYSHHGVDVLAIARTIGTNIAHSKRYGASTISMQAIKLGERAKRTIPTKIKESLQALRLEMRHSKDEILRIYVDNAPYGSNIVGIKSAALLYFRKPLGALSPAEMALLAVMPNAPNLIFTAPNKLANKRNLLLERALRQNLINAQDYKLALLEPLPKLERQNSIAPHYTMFLAQRYAGQKVFYTHINKSLQSLLERRAKEYASVVKDKGASNLALIVLDSRNGEVAGYVGSQDFYDIKGLGQIDGVQANRSVGSTLKPFLYALCLDAGLIIPQTKLPDVNQFYGNFNPQNASLNFYGKVSALNALRASLNAPFVALLQDFGLEEFFYFLRANAGFYERDFSKYGLSLILGTKELSLFQLSKLYLGLRRGGVFDEIKLGTNTIERGGVDSGVAEFSGRESGVRESKIAESGGLEAMGVDSGEVDFGDTDSGRAESSGVESSGADSGATNAPNPRIDKRTKARHIDLLDAYIHHQSAQNPTSATPISKEAAYITLQSLLDLSFDLQSAKLADKIAWKSGTSFGNHDSWAVGASDKWVIGVWGGNFDARSSTKITGREIAGRFMFDIFGLLSQDAREFGEWAEVGKWSRAPQMRAVHIDENGYRTLDSSARVAYMPAFAKPLRTAQESSANKPIIVYPTQGLRLENMRARVDFAQAQKVDSGANHEVESKGAESKNAESSADSEVDFGADSALASRVDLQEGSVDSMDFAPISRAKPRNSAQSSTIELVALIDTKEKAYFFLNGEFVGANALGRIRLAPKVGKNTLYVIKQDGSSDSVWFEVIR